MLSRIGGWPLRDDRVRSAAAARGPRRASCGLAVQYLEDRVVLSDISGLPTPPTGPAAVGPADAAAPVSGPAAGGTGFVPLFNGVNLSGWFIPYDWGQAAVAKNGDILLTGNQNFFLVSKQIYQNFIVEADVWIPPKGNSGLQFRSQYGHNFMQGYQADMDTTASRNWAGGLWFQGRGWLVRAHPRAPVKPGQWNHYVVTAIGNHITIAVNGRVTVNTYNNIASTGHLALQDHGSPGIYRFRTVEIEVLPN
jgi:hypothetical protein